MIVKLPEGTGGAHAISIELDDDFASTPIALWFTYDVAITGRITPVNSATTGAISLLMTGSNYGFSDTSIGVATGGSK
jgi:hypothetical protein